MLSRFRKFFQSQPADHSLGRSILMESKETNFNFRLYQGNDAYSFPAKSVDILEDKVILTDEKASITVLYSQMYDIQVLPKSKTVSIVVRTRPFWILWLFAPLIIGAFLIAFAEQFSKFYIVVFPIYEFDMPREKFYLLAKYFISGFGWAVGIIGYGSLFIGMQIYTESLRSLKKRAVSTGRIHTVIKQLEQLVNKEDEYFAKLINVNLSNIEAYYLLVKAQSDNSFRLTLACAIAGFIVLMAGILLSFIKGTDNSATTITVASGVLIEFISAIFFYLYNKSVIQLNSYHDKLIDVQDTMLALKVSQDIKNDEVLKNQTLKYLTEALTSRLVHPDSKYSKSPQIQVTEDQSSKTA
jgi:hypothetical protein